MIDFGSGFPLLATPGGGLNVSLSRPMRATNDTQRVKSRNDALKSRCPLCPRKRTFLVVVSMSAKGHKHTHAPQQRALYSISSSARMRSDSGTSIPCLFAVFRLTSKLIWAGSSTGRSAGLVPLRICLT
jgi:hypothetical protein